MRKTATNAEYAVVSANGASRTIHLHGKHHGPKGKGKSILKNLEDGTIVKLSLFNGDPENGGTLVTSSNFTVGETSLRDAFKALFDAAGDASFDYLVITVGDESYTRHIHARKKK